MLRTPAGAAASSGMGGGDDIARSGDLLRPAGQRSVRSCRRRARCQPWSNGPTASPRCSDDLESREAVLLAVAGAFATGALFAATHPSRTTALVVLEGYANPIAERTETSIPRKSSPPWSPCGEPANTGFRSIPTCHGTRRSAPRGRDMTGLRRAREPRSHVASGDRGRRAGGASDNPRANPRRPARRRPVDRARVGQVRR